MKKNLVKGVALVAVSILGVTGLSLAPANATAANKTVIVQEGNTLSGLNTAVNGKNLVTNVDVVYPTGSGFTYWNNKAQLVRNTAFGTFKITRNNCQTSVTTDEFGCFAVTYTIKKGLKYSDGTLITAQDLLLSHAISSSDYAIKAGLGDPMSDAGSAFDSAGYGGAYDDHTRANSFDLSDDNYSVTVKYDAFQPDWQIFGPGPGAVHALVGLAKGKKTFQTARTNASYKSLFEDAYYTAIDALPASDDPDYADALADRTAARDLLKKMAAKWSTSFNITTVTPSTNPLLLISNGGFQITSCGASSCTLDKNPLASVSGAPKMTGNLDRIIFKFPATGTTFNDTAVGQAIKNGEVDLYSGSATASFWSTVSSDPGVVAARTSVATYEHFDIRAGDALNPNSTVNSDGNCAAPYDGPFKGSSQRAKDLRKAMLLVVPRQVIANTYVGKIFDPGFSGDSPVLNSLFSLTTEGDYSKVVAGSSSYVNEFTKDQDTRNAAALALMKKYYPSAGAGSNSINVKMLTSTAARRVDIALQIKLQAAKVGINVTNTASTGWSGLLNCNNYDVVTFAWSKSAISQTGTNPQYQSDGSNNRAGWKDPDLDTLLKRFEGSLSATEIVSAKIAAERQLWSNFWTIGEYQWPGVSAWNKDLKNVLPSPLNPNVVWNYWALGY
ncbi:MAG: ABC transporter substrate-binding protein [Rhodoluna sp.]|nr:ABC transporter substrate-binding protein [Rhodoluna sp.]